MKKKIFIALLICISNNIIAQKKEKTEGITGTIHQKYLSKIVFTTNFDPSLNKSKEVETNFKNEFDLTPESNIFFRAYFDNSIYNYIKPLVKNNSESSDLKNYGIGFNFYLDNIFLDKLKNKTDKEFTEEQKKSWTTFRGALIIDSFGVYTGEPQFKELIEIYGDKLTMGKHHIKVEMYPVFIDPNNDEITKGNIVASGEFNLNIKKGVFDPNDEKLCLKKNVLKDNELIKNIAKAHSNNGGAIVSSEDVRVLSNSWYIERNSISGIIERRSMYVVVGYKNKNDNKCYKLNYTIYQEFIGSKFSDEIRFKQDLGTNEEINCLCLKQ